MINGELEELRELLPKACPTLSFLSEWLVQAGRRASSEEVLYTFGSEKTSWALWLSVLKIKIENNQSSKFDVQGSMSWEIRVLGN